MVLAEMWHSEHPQSVRATQFLASTYAKTGLYDAAKGVLNDGIEELPEAGELYFQLALLHCIYGRAETQDFEQLLDISSTVNRARIVPDVLTALRAHVGSQYCGDALNAETYSRLIENLLRNPSYADAEMQAHLHYLLAEFNLMLDQPRSALDQFRKSYGAQPDHQIALNEANIAIYLGLVDYATDALGRALDLERPLFERWVHPASSQTERIETRIRAMEKMPEGKDQ